MDNIQKGIKRIRDHTARMTELGNTSQRISMQYEAHMTLYTVGASSRDEETMAKERETLHSLLDHLLDNAALFGSAQHELQEIIASVGG